MPTLMPCPEIAEPVADLSPKDTADEAAIRAMLRRDRPRLAAAFDAARPRGRRAILHRLLQAVVRENLAGAGERARPTDGGRSLAVPAAGGVIHAGVARRFSLARYDFAGPVLFDRDGRTTPLAGPRELLDLLRSAVVPAGDAEAARRFERFGDELDNSAANAALALVGAQLRGTRLREEAARMGVADLAGYVGRRVAAERVFSPLAFFEQWVVDGHPLHPGAKIKMGMSPADVLRYSPEWVAEPDVRLAAVRKEVCRVSSLSGDSPAARLGREYPGLQATAEAELVSKGLRPEEYELLPVHPWQFEHTLPRLHATAIARGDVVLLDGPRIATQALMSVRSLSPIQARGAGRHHIKTPIDVQCTGAVRTISQNAAENGPMLTRVFEAIQEREDRFGGRFRVLAEDLGAYYRPRPERPRSEDEGDAATLGKHLAVVFRENPENHVRDGELPLVGSALIAASPLGEGPIVGELIAAFGRAERLAGPAAAVAFLKRYAEVAVPPLLTLMSRYGVSLEAHLQNSVLVFKDGAAVRLLVRDFGGVRVLRERLARQGLTAEFFPGSATETDDVDDLRGKMFYPFVQNHLGELIAAVVRSTGMEEADLWRPVAEVCRAVYAELKANAAIADQAAADEAALFRPTLPLKAMATMRLLGDVTRYSFSDVPNPLAG